MVLEPGTQRQVGQGLRVWVGLEAIKKVGKRAGFGARASCMPPLTATTRGWQPEFTQQPTNRHQPPTANRRPTFEEIMAALAAIRQALPSAALKANAVAGADWEGGGGPVGRGDGSKAGGREDGLGGGRHPAVILSCHISLRTRFASTVPPRRICFNSPRWPKHLF